MEHALQLARQGLGRTSPNPCVGAVVVKEGRVVGEGYHACAGAPHAEIQALRRAGPAARGATLYVTLEPCVHYGRTPPCAPEVVRAGIKRAVIAMLDPNPVVKGKGVALLEASGIEVKVGVREEEAARLNEFFQKYITSGTPFVALKMAMTLDGKTATSCGASRWITGKEARTYVHELRNQYDAVLVGVGTVIADNPLLTTRLPQGGRNAKRIVLDSTLRLPLEAKILEPNPPAPALVVTTPRAPLAKRETLLQKGAEVVVVGEKGGRVNLEELLKLLGDREVTSLLVEGGPTVNAAFLEAGLIDKVFIFIAPKILGGREAPGVVGGEGKKDLAEAWKLHRLEVKFHGEDLLVEGYLVKEEGTCLQASSRSWELSGKSKREKKGHTLP